MTIIVNTAGPTGFTYLQLCQRLRREVGANGTGPSSVLGQSGEYQRIVDWIADADEEVQQEHDTWKFMNSPFGVATIPGVNTYPAQLCDPPINDLRIWRERGMKCYDPAVGLNNQWHLSYIDPETWDSTYNTGARTPGMPQHFSYSDANELLVGPTPDRAYTITGVYQRACTRMLVDTDQPKYPAEFHMLAVYLAMMKFGRFTGAAEVYSDGERLYGKMLMRMRRSQLPQMNTFIPLA